MSHLLELRDIKKSYGSLSVLSGLSLRCEPGHFYALVGRNGSGKSTLMRIATRVEPPDKGHGEILGKSILKDHAEVNRQVAYVSEQLSYPRWISLRRFFAHYAGFFPGWDHQLFMEIMNPLGFDLERKFISLSRGQKMQVATAAALALRPKLLLLDEITAVLDASARSYFLGLLSDSVKKGSTVVLATNVVSELHSYATHLLFLNRGKIEIDESIHDVASKFVKLRKPRGNEHPVFDNNSCVAVGVDDDGSLLYLIPEKTIQNESLPTELRSARLVRPEEVFVYLTSRENSVT